MKLLTLTSMTLTASLLACSNTDGPGFHGGTNTVQIPKLDYAAGEAIPSNPPAPAEAKIEEKVEARMETPVESQAESISMEPLASQASIAAVELTLKVTLPSNEVRAGKNQIQAVAELSRPVDSEILWTLEGPSGKDFGSIDTKGNYTSPEVVSEKLNVVIVATLANDQTITGKKSLEVIPVEQLFVGCVKANVAFPINADVFHIVKDTQKLPDFAKMTKADTVCLDQFAIKTQGWEAGFPGSPELKEWFGLRSTAKIIVPKKGKYIFRTHSDDGSIFKINGVVVVDNDGIHQPTSQSGAIELEAGKHDILLDWYQGPRTQIALQLFWTVPGEAEVIVPPSAFSAK